MAFVPSTNLWLLNVPIDASNKNQLDFSSAAAQAEYFASRRIRGFTDFSYQRRDSTIRVGMEIDSLWDCNYVMYQNANFGSKWFYAFITKMEYVNASMTNIYIETDVWQTWQFDISIKDSFIVREHVNDDTPGRCLTDEGLDMGEYIRCPIQKSTDMEVMNIVMVATEYKTSSGEWIKPEGYMKGGIYTALVQLVYPLGEIQRLNNDIAAYYEAGKSESIQALYLVPHGGLTQSSPQSVFQDYYDITINVPSAFGGYTPKNNRLLCFPYNMLYVTDNNGKGSVFHYEKFASRTAPVFRLEGSCIVPMEVACWPRNYKGQEDNYSEMMVMAAYPQCTWTSDVYKNWLAQNRDKLFLESGSNVIKIAAGAVSENPFMALQGAEGVINQMAELRDRSVVPMQANGQQAGNVNARIGINNFHFIPTQITAEFAQRLDKFFSMYGYKVSAVKVPNITGRRYWNYVQTIDINITGAVPSDDMVKLKAIFNKGITFWHSPSNVGNYSLDNVIV